MYTHPSTTVEQLSYRELKTYLLAALFIVGNIVLPQLCHLIPGGGLRWLPIYFFTLIAAYRYGIVAGLATAVCSPLLNNMLFGMPPTPMLPVILVKSALLAVAAAAIASRVGRVTLWAVALAVVAYQSVGMMAEWFITASLDKALQDIVIGWPGIMAQVIVGHLVLVFSD